MGRVAGFKLVLVAFALFGAIYGVWLVLLADLQRTLGLSPGALGGALAAGLAASLPVMLLGGRVADRWGVGVLLRGAALLIASALIGVAGAQAYWSLVLLLMLFFASTGAFDVAINAAAIGVEQASGRNILAYFHAAFSGSAALTALLTGALLSYGVLFRWLYLALALLVFAFAVFTKRDAVKKPTASPSVPLVTERRKSLLRSAPVLLLAFITALAFQIEGEIGNWATIYLRTLLELPPWLSASGLAVFHSAMLVGRLGAAWALGRYRRRSLLRLTGGVAAGGMMLALATQSAPVTLCGFLVTGLAVAVIVPVTFSLVGDSAPERVGEASSILTTVAYLGLLLGPVIVGGLAELFGSRLALASIIVMGGAVSLLGCWVPEGGSPVVEKAAPTNLGLS